MPKGEPPLWHFSAMARKVSHVHLSASSLSGGPPAGYILVISRPPNSLNLLMRAQGGLTWLPLVAGTATHLPFCLPRYLTAPLTLPLSAIACSTMLITCSDPSALPRRCET